MRYEYQCKKCDIIIEEDRHMDDRDKDGKCPKCKAKTERVASTFGFKVNGYASINGYALANVKR